MRKPMTLFFKAWLFALFMVSAVGLMAQKAPNDAFLFNYTIQFDTAYGANQLEFDLYLLDTDPTEPFEMATVQAGILVNPAIYNGGTVTASIVPNSSQLNAVQKPTSVTFTQSQNVIKLASKAPPGIGNGTIISTTAPGTRICRLRLTNTVPFVQCSHADLTFNFSTTPYPTKVSIYWAGLNQPCTMTTTNTFSLAANVGLNCPPPVLFNVTGGGSYCQGSTGLPVGLDGSEIGTTYTLYKDGVAQVPTVAGTGSAITFGNQLAGTYTVKGTNGGGTVDMTGSAIIIETPATPVSVSIVEDANNVCEGTTVNYLATPINGGPTPAYQWYVNNILVGSGSPTYSYVPLNNDAVKVIMTSDLGGCLSGNPATSNIITMVVIPSGPALVSINASANPSCGTETVTFTPTPTNGGTPTYQWFVNSVLAGTSGTYSYVPATGDQVYVIMTSSLSCATGNPATSNTITMTVDVPVPVSVSILADNTTVCAGTQVTFTPTPNNGGTTPSYQWYVNGVPYGGAISGPLTYAPANNDQVYVIMTSSLTCTTGNPATSNSITITTNPLPTPTLAGPVSICAGTSGNVYTTEVGYLNYAWNVSAGGIVTAGGTNTDNTVTVTWVGSGPQTVSVNYSDVNNCVAVSPTVYNVTVNPLPVPIMSGPSSVCLNSTGNVYSTQAGMTGYNWIVSAGGTVTAGGTNTDNTVTVTWTTLGPQTVSVNYTNANGCTATTPSVANITVNPLPVPFLTGAGAACVNSTGNVYSTDAGMTGYNWAVTGGTITAGSGTNAITVTWNTAGPQTVSVNYTNGNGCTAVSPTVLFVTVNALPVPTISGPAPVCVQSTGNVYTTEAGMTGYTWAVSAGGTITAGAGTNAITVTWNTTGPQTVSVNYTNANSCTAASATVYNVAVNIRPVPTLSGTTPAGVGTSHVYTTEAGQSSYAWSVSPGGTITAGGTPTSNTATVLWNTAGAQQVCVNYNNASGCPAITPTCFSVTVISIPPPAGPITGTAVVCQGAMGVAYSVAAIPNATGYVWNLPAGATIASGANTNSITVNYGYTAVSGPITVYGTNTYGNGAPSPAFNVTVNAAPVPTITGPAAICSAAAGNVYTTQAGMTNYVWVVSAGGSITAGGTGTSNTVTITWTGSGAQTVSVSYTNSNGCSAAAPTVYNVSVGALPVPTITGDNDVCEDSDYYWYTTEPGMTNYVWNMSPNSGTITWVNGSNQVMIFWTAPGAKWVSVTYTNSAGCTAAAPTVFNVEVDPLPGAAGTITGTATVCAGTNGVTYSIAPVTNATSYAWTVPAGATIASGSTTNTITVNYGATATSGNIMVHAVNACGDGLPSPAFAVTVNSLPAAAGAITGPNSVCQGTSGITYTVGTIANATGYTWTVPAGATIVSGANTNTITVNFSSTASSGTVTVLGTNSCGSGTAATLSVAVNPVPSAPVITLNGYTLTSSALVGNQWYKDGEMLAGATGQTYNVTATGTYWAVVTINGCSSDTSNNIYVLYIGLDELVKIQKVEIYPNPNNGRFTLSMTTSAREVFDLRILNNLGVPVYERKGLEVDGSLEEVINLNHIPNGVYSVVINTLNKQIIRKVVIN